MRTLLLRARPALFALSLIAPLATGCSKKGFGSDFEGAITMHTTKPGQAGTDMTVLVKGDKLRFEMPAPGGEDGHAIFDPETNKVSMVFDSKKSYMDLDFNKPSAATNTSPDTSSVVKSGKHETIAGVDCEDWTAKDPSGKRSEVCIAKGIAFFDIASLRGGGSGSGLAKDLREQKLFPMRSVEYDASGKEISRMEVTKVEHEKFDAAKFAIPSDYTKLEMPAHAGAQGTH